MNGKCDDEKSKVGGYGLDLFVERNIAEQYICPVYVFIFFLVNSNVKMNICVGIDAIK